MLDNPVRLIWHFNSVKPPISHAKIFNKSSQSFLIINFFVIFRYLGPLLIRNAHKNEKLYYKNVK